jgi:hypothetical protein
MSESQGQPRIEEICARLEALSTLVPRPLAIAVRYPLQHQMDTAIYSIIRNYVSRRENSRAWDTHPHLDIFRINFNIVIEILQGIMPSIPQILSVELGLSDSLKP